MPKMLRGLGVAPTAKFSQTVAWETLQEYDGK
jgi:hypothetical protein